MKLVRWLHEDGTTRIGALRGVDNVVEIHPGEVDLGHPDRYSTVPLGEPRHKLADLQVLAPLQPGKIVATGLNYRDHAEETGLAIPERPLLFAKYPSSVTGPYDNIHLHPETTELDYEGELGVIIGHTGRNISPKDALRYIFGYVVANDVSARDAQFADQQWVRGKSFDTFAPFGPALVTADEITDPSALRIRTWVNGELRQDSDTKHLIFDVATLVAYCSSYFTLEPGDLLLTGTPGGVGMSMNPPRYLTAGDQIEVEVDGLGRITNTVIAAPLPTSST